MLPQSLTKAASSPAVNQPATVTIKAPGAGRRIVLTGYTISSDLTPAASGDFTIATEDRQELERARVGSGSRFPHSPEFAHPLAAAPGHEVVATLPALGAGVTGTVALRYRIETVAD